jgi:hypothetical protein
VVVYKIDRLTRSLAATREPLLTWNGARNTPGR